MQSLKPGSTQGDSPGMTPGGGPSAEFRAALATRVPADPADGAGAARPPARPLPAPPPAVGTVADATPARDSPPVPLSPAEITRWLAVLTGLCIPIATSPAEVMTGLFVVSWLISEPTWWRTSRLAAPLDHAAPRRGAARFALLSLDGSSRLALLLFACLTLGLTWSTAGWGPGFRCLLKYRELLLLPLFVPVFREPQWRRRGRLAFLTGCAVLLAMSTGEWLTQLDFGLERNNLPTNYVVTKDRIIHGLLMSLLTYLCLLEARERIGRARWFLVALAACAVWNNVFLVQGRTGFIALAALAILWFARQAGRRGVWLGGVLVLCGALTAGLLSPIVRARFDQTLSQFRDQFGEQPQRSLDPRLEFYRHTSRLIARSPWTGTGTGSFEPEYRQLAREAGIPPVSEPHNEYLLLSVQLGLAGGLLWLGLLATQWSLSRTLPPLEGGILQGAVLTLALGCLFNSLLLSVTGGLVWAFLTGLAVAAQPSRSPPDIAASTAVAHPRELLPE